MRKYALIVLTLALLSAYDRSHGGPVVSQKAPQHFKIHPITNHYREIAFRGAESATVAVYGDQFASLGLYVFDEHGNCIALDDDGTATNQWGCAVQLYPAREQTCVVEVHNLGLLISEYTLMTR